MVNEPALNLSPSPRVGRLDSLQAVRRELSRVYADARRGKIPTTDGTRLAFILTSIARIIEGSDLEKRLEALEARAKGRHYEQIPE